MTLRGTLAKRMFEAAILEIRKAHELSTPEEFKEEMCQLFNKMGHTPDCMKCKAAA